MLMDTDSQTAENALNSETLPVRLWGVVRFFIAILLIIAAVLKTNSEGMLGIGVGFLSHQKVVFAIVSVEFAVAVLLLVNYLPRYLWTLTTALFLAFFLFAFGRALFGKDNCLCFGDLKVHPWYTSTLDLTILCLLFRCRKIRSVSQDFSVKRTILAATLWLGAILPVTYMFASVEKTDLGDLGTVYTSADGHKTIQLKPENWTKGECPLLNWAEIDKVRDQLTSGEWTVVIYRSDCPDCRNALEDLKSVGQKNVICIEVPPYGKNDTVPEGFIRVRLPEKVTWVIKTPLIIESVRYSGEQYDLSRML